MNDLITLLFLASMLCLVLAGLGAVHGLLDYIDRKRTAAMIDRQHKNLKLGRFRRDK